MSDLPLLQVQKMSKRFPGVQALKCVDFDLRRGEVHALLGENGAGKSTLMKILSGVYQKDDGRLYLDGAEINIQGPRHAQELGIGTIYQELNLVDSLSVAENIFLAQRFLSKRAIVNRVGLRKRAAELLEELQIDVDPKAIVKHLSVGKRQMVEIAKALAFRPRILIMDEPTSSLSLHETEKVFELMRNFKSGAIDASGHEQKAIIFISHKLAEIFEIGDRVTVLRDGALIGAREVSETEERELVKMMVGRELVDLFPQRGKDFGEVVLEVRGLTKGGMIQNASLFVRKGEILGIAGLVGSGRTELVKTILGIYRKDHGETKVGGKTINLAHVRTAIKNGIGYVPEDRHREGLMLNMPIRKNISLSSLLKLATCAILRYTREVKLADDYIADLNISARSRDQKVMYLSGGNQQKVVLSKVLATNPDVLILDDPTRGVDVGAKAEIYELMKELTDKGVAIILISSELPEILGMSDRIVILHRGRIAGELDASEATQEKVMHYATGGR